MGGKGDDNSSNNNDQLALQTQRQQQAQLAASQLKQQTAAAEEPAKAKEETPPVTEAVQQPTDQQPTGDNLTGLGDALVSGLSPGRMQQVTDQQDRLKANPQTYGTQFDPYSGTFVGQGRYDGSQTGGQV